MDLLQIYQQGCLLLASIIDCNLASKERHKLQSLTLLIDLYSLSKVIINSSKLLGHVCPCWTTSLRSFQIFSSGLRSRLFVGHSRVVCASISSVRLSVMSDKVHVHPIRVNVLLTLDRVNLDLLCLWWLPHPCHIAATLDGRDCCGRIYWWRDTYAYWKGAYAGRGAHTSIRGAHTPA
jgi:hypothetical protein